MGAVTERPRARDPGREHVWKGQWQFDASYRVLNLGYVATSDVR